MSSISSLQRHSLPCPWGFDCEAMTGISTASDGMCINADVCHKALPRYSDPMPELADPTFDLDRYLRSLWAEVLDNG